MKLRLLACALPFALFACGDDDEDLAIDAPILDGEVDGPVDANLPDPDAPIDAPTSVQVIPDCTGIANFAVTVNAGSGAYVPQNPTLAVNQVLRFIPGSPAHDITADNGDFATALGQTACLRFTAPGTFPVHCGIHQFTGTITVTAN